MKHLRTSRATQTSKDHKYERGKATNDARSNGEGKQNADHSSRLRVHESDSPSSFQRVFPPSPYPHPLP
eukprot:2042519-Rhodomonas_salina.1